MGTNDTSNFEQLWPVRRAGGVSKPTYVVALDGMEPQWTARVHTRTHALLGSFFGALRTTSWSYEPCLFPAPEVYSMNS